MRESERERMSPSATIYIESVLLCQQDSKGNRSLRADLLHLRRGNLHVQRARLKESEYSRMLQI